MAEIVNADWYSMNNTRMYPISDVADGIATNGDNLPTGAIVDLMLRFAVEDNVTYHYRPYISGIYISTNAVGISFETEVVKRSDRTIYDKRPIGAMSVSNPVPYQVETFTFDVDGEIKANGRVVFGSEIGNSVDLKFDGYSHSGLVPSAARPFLPGLKKPLRVEDREEVSGMVELTANSDLTLSIDDRDIVDNGTQRSLIVGLVLNHNNLVKFLPEWAWSPETFMDTMPPITSINGISSSEISFKITLSNKFDGMSDSDFIETATGQNATAFIMQLGWQDLCEMNERAQKSQEVTDDYYDPTEGA